MRVFISGLCGTLGGALAQLHADRGDTVWGCSRNESRAVEWLAAHPRLATLFLCNAVQLANPSSDIGRLLSSMDRVYHCAAMKHVDLCESNPIEAHRQNVDLTHLVAVACEQAGVPMVFISSDKACLPQGVYGATKLLAEREALRHGAAVVRLGNLIGSSGSVFEKWINANRVGELVSLTDPEMTRYFLPVNEAARFVADSHYAPAVSMPLMHAVRMGDVADAMTDARLVITGRRPGETKHQWLVAPGERIVMHSNAILLDAAGKEMPEGLSSAHAPRWDVAELLEAAGIRRECVR